MFEPDDYRTCHNCGKETYIDLRKLCQQCYTSEWVPYNKFLDIEYIAEGGFSKIFKATWNLNGQKRHIVLKALNNSKNANTKFLNELKLTYQLKSKFVIKCYGATQNPKTKNYAFILDYAPNGDLNHFLRKNFKKVTWKKKLNLFRDIIIGIKLLHDKKIVHCDLHSGNILIITNDFKAVISDLGFSQRVTSNSENSKKPQPQMYGVISYMASELFKGQSYSYASDIYSLGMIMWQLTSGHRPFHDREHGPILILDILDGKRPKTTKDTPESTQNPKTKNYAFILDYAPNGDLNHFLRKNFKKVTWKKKLNLFRDIIIGIKLLHDKKIVHCDLHSGNILIITNDFKAVISDLGFSQRVTSNSENSKKPQPQMYGVISYMASELFKGQSYSYASDIYSLGMIMWQLTSGHRPFHDREHGPILILDILDGKRPKTTKDTPECWENLMKKCWHPDPSQRPTIDEIYQLFIDFKYYCDHSKDDTKKHYPDKCDILLEFQKAEKVRLEMIKSKKPFVNNPFYEHPNSRYFSTPLDSMLESIINSDQFLIDKFDINNSDSDRIDNIENSEQELSDQFSNDNFDIMDNNSDRINNIENSVLEENSKNSNFTIFSFFCLLLFHILLHVLLSSHW
ncbi:hypothetical protein Glove_595g7 [Diversispora epigaea]|uniref:Protein kinase domain-containing protein n=1 Tax=Diversispora epigaea TaxID=1348612 RepID=A0A397GBN0_9GLOM|nr:hypothetical protein Glove_595g7 [Diversispora epigaea]